jgi:hypothetical protein
MHFADPFTAPGQWYRGNLHSHTTASDGQQTPEEMARRYRAAGYGFLAVTDHGVVADVAGLSDDGFLVLFGAELDGDISETGETYHICAFGLEGVVEAPKSPNVQQAVDWARESGGDAVIAHPYWSGLAFPDLMRCDGYLGIEVFNTTCHGLNGKGCAAAQWDDLLARGRRVWGLGVDDCHGGADFGLGHVMVKATALTREAIMTSLRAGLFYSSWGPVIHGLRVADGAVEVRTCPARMINFVGPAWMGKALYSRDGQPITEAAYRLPERIAYLRVECQDFAGRWAWSNPMIPGR